MNYKVGVIGRFGFGKELLNGQTIKTKTVVSNLADAIGEEALLLVDTYGGFKMLLHLPFDCFRVLQQCENVVILPAHKGIRIIAPLLWVMNKFFRRRLHYVVIGGWLNKMLEGKPLLRRCLKGFDWIYAETGSMARRLESDGFRNVVRMPNFKTLKVLSEEELPREPGQPCRLCTFSRVMKEKGIATAAHAVQAVNDQFGKTVYTLDIYGQVDAHQTQWFETLRQTFPDAVCYCGEVPFDQSVSVLRNYDALLFPTEFYTEGIPGTIIDAYAAGLPVIASMWENYSDIIGADTGIVYPFGQPEELKMVLTSLAEDPARLIKMKPACLRKARAFTPECVLKILTDRLMDED